MKIAFLGGALLVALLVAARLFRFEYLPPIEYKDIATPENPLGRSIVVCVADRWSNGVNCESVIVDAKRNAKEMEQWLKQGIGQPK
jgi:hypothetical protein